jgi:hypothetical protein
VFDTGVVELKATGLSRDELMRVAEGVRDAQGTDDVHVVAPPGFDLLDD